MRRLQSLPVLLRRSVWQTHRYPAASDYERNSVFDSIFSHPILDRKRHHHPSTHPAGRHGYKLQQVLPCKDRPRVQRSRFSQQLVLPAASLLEPRRRIQLRRSLGERKRVCRRSWVYGYTHTHTYTFQDIFQDIFLSYYTDAYQWRPDSIADSTGNDEQLRPLLLRPVRRRVPEYRKCQLDHACELRRMEPQRQERL